MVIIPKLQTLRTGPADRTGTGTELRAIAAPHLHRVGAPHIMSRSSLVAMLIAVEVAIVGMARLRGARRSLRVHAAEFVAKTIAPIDAGASPRVAIDDADSRVDVAVSTDGLVHVNDLTSMHGAFFGGRLIVPQLDVKRVPPTAFRFRVPGRATPAFTFNFGWFGTAHRSRRSEPDRTSTSRAAPAPKSAASPAAWRSHRKTATSRSPTCAARSTRRATTDRYRRRACAATTCTLQSADGRLTLDDVIGIVARRANQRRQHRSARTFASPAERSTRCCTPATARFGWPWRPAPISRSTHRPATAKLSSTVNRRKRGDGDSAQHTVRLGSGSGSLQLSSGDGSIHITTNGAV